MPAASFLARSLREKWGSTPPPNLGGQFLGLGSRIDNFCWRLPAGARSLRDWISTTLRPLVVPGGILLLGVTVGVYSGWLTLTLPALSFLYYCALIGGLLLAWKFHSSRVFLGLLVLFLACQALTLLASGRTSTGHPELTAFDVVVALVPLNFVLIAFMRERGFTQSGTAPMLLFLFVQSVIIAVLGRSEEPLRPLPARGHHLAATVSLPGYVQLAVAAALVLLLMRYLMSRKPLDSALPWSLAAFYLSAHFTGTARLSILYSATAACILAASIIENSYLLAYHDELTTLPSRRAFNDALQRLQETYSIAVVDIDHFKRFNDTYGHDTGDQVLRLVASNLSRVSGGGQAYRCGGEEFAILFPGKAATEVVDHLERLRLRIEGSEFHMRGAERRQVPRGPERRNQRGRGRSRTGHAIRRLAHGSAPLPLSVTVSMGVATSAKEQPHPDLVLQAADKALYRAKANGRNRIETAPERRRARAKTAGIA